MRFAAKGLSCVLLLLVLWGCSQEPLTIPLRITPLATGSYVNLAQDENRLHLVFLGTGGIYLQHAEQAVLGDPFYSNPPILDWLLLRELQVRPLVIDRYLPPTEYLDAILVAHAHHDHAMDVPYIAAKLEPQVKVYGSATLRNSLLSALDPERLVAVNSQAAGAGRNGTWITINDSLRILPLLSGHAPHLFGKVFNSEVISQPQSQVPATALDWQSGQALSYVVDFLVNGEPRFRVYYQSSAADPPDGLPPQWMLQDGKSVDLALLGIANYNKLEDFPVSLLQALQPGQVVLLHWDVFWDEYSQDITRPVPGLDLITLSRKLEAVLPADIPVYLPDRGAVLSIQESL